MKYNIVVLSIGILLLNPLEVHAYVDPSAMSYLVQAVAGTAIGLGAIAGIAWRIIKKNTAAVLKIDDTSSREVEPDIVAIEQPKMEDPHVENN